MPVTMRGRLRPHLGRLVRAMLIGGLATEFTDDRPQLVIGHAQLSVKR